MMMKHFVTTTALCFFGAASMSAQAPQLRVEGGSFPGTLQAAMTGAPGKIAAILLDTTPGPTPLALIDRKDPRNLSVGMNLLQVGLAFSGPCLPPNWKYQTSAMSVPNNPSFKGATLYWQGFTLPGTQYFVGPLSNPTATRFYPKSNFVDRGVKLRVAVSFPQVLEIPGNKYMVIGGGQGGLLAQIATKNCEIYDVMTDRFVPGPLMVTEHSVHTATKLLDGRILVAGGVDIQNNPQSAAEIWDPKTNAWTKLPSMSSKRAGHDAALLADGRVWVSGGYAQNVTGGNILSPITSAVDTTEIYDPKTNKWVAGPVMIVPRVGHRVILLSNGKYMIVGGLGWYRVLVKLPTVWTNCDFFDPKTNKITAGPAMAGARGIAPIVDLGGGKILVSGGVATISLTSPGKVTNTAEIYDVATNKWTTVGSMKQARGMHFGFALGNGKYIHIGGGNGTVLKPLAIATTEVFDAKTRTWSSGPSLGTSRAAYGYIRTPEGQIHIIGGGTGPSAINVNTSEWLY